MHRKQILNLLAKCKCGSPGTQASFFFALSSFTFYSLPFTSFELPSSTSFSDIHVIDSHLFLSNEA